MRYFLIIFVATLVSFGSVGITIPTRIDAIKPVNSTAFQECDYESISFSEGIVPQVDVQDFGTSNLVLAKFTYDIVGHQFAFNPGLSAIPGTNNFLISFRHDLHANGRHQAYTSVFEVNKDFKPISRVQHLTHPCFESDDPDCRTIQAEDVRLFTFGTNIYSLYNDNLDGRDMGWHTRRQHFARLTLDSQGRWIAERPQRLEFLGNRGGPEKNWVPFEREKELLFGYSLHPHEVLKNSARADAGFAHTKVVSRDDRWFPWSSDLYGELRGGTPAIFIPETDEYLAMFHSVKQVGSTKKYYFGAYTFDKEGLYIRRISSQPILFEGLYDSPKGYWVSQMSEQSFVVFPMGVTKTVYKGRAAFAVSAGVNDSSVNIFMIDQARLFDSMLPSGNPCSKPHLNDDARIQCSLQLPSENIRKYPKVSEHFRDHGVYVSLTTSPTRIHQLPKVLATINPAVRGIFLVVPERFGRDGSKYEIPDEVLNFPKLTVMRIPKDLGPITKLLPAVEFLQKVDPEAILITIDDDTAYPQGSLMQLYKYAVLQDAVVSASTVPLSNWRLSTLDWPAAGPKECSRTGLSECDVVEGFAGVAYKAKHVDVELMKKLSDKSRFPNCFVSDDLLISYVLERNGIKKYQINDARYANLPSQLSFGFEADALHRGAGLLDHAVESEMNAAKYQFCLDELAEAVREDAF